MVLDTCLRMLILHACFNLDTQTACNNAARYACNNAARYAGNDAMAKRKEREGRGVGE